MESKKYEDFENEAKQYRKILQEYRRTREPFIDPNFHPLLSINERDVTIDSSTCNWKRIDELSDAPLFQKKLINPDFVQQGDLGDCYFLSALSRIAKQPYLVPLLFDKETPDQIMGKVKDSINIKSGAVVIYFNCFGRRTPVLIDTLLPTKSGKLIYSHPVDNGKSAWFCLVEKAYAKLNGSYSDIIGGTLPQAIYSIFCYYPSIKEFESLNKPEKLKEMSVFDRIMKYQKKGAVMGTAINLSKLKTAITKNEISSKGLIPNHCYLLLKAREHDGKRFFCLRNPWGDHEWNGDYSDESPKWTPSLKEGLGWRNADDGTFWMADYDYFKYFTGIKISLPLRPEWYSKHYYIQIRPGDHDGYNVDGQKAKIEERPNYAFQVIDPINEGEKCRFHILVEKRQTLFDDKNNVLYKAPKYCIVLAHSNGEKLSPEVLNKSSSYTMTSTMSLLCFAYEVTGNNDIITIVLHRIEKCNLIEDCYIQIFCEKDFKLYDIDHPDELIPEDATNGIVFDNFSLKHPKVASPLKIKRIKSKDVLTFGSMTGIDFEKLREELNAQYKEEESNSYKYEEKVHSKNKESENDKESISNNNENNSDSKAACYFVVSPLKIKNLVYKGSPANDFNTFVQFSIDGKSYQTETVGQNANPEFKEIVIPIKDLKIGGCLIIDILHGTNQNMKKICSSMRLPLNGMEIDPLMTYSIETSLSSGQDSGDISFSAKLLLEKDLNQSSNQPPVKIADNSSDGDNDSDYILEFTINEASCDKIKNDPQISISLKSNKSQKLSVKTKTKYQINIRDPKSELIYFIFNDDNGKTVADTTFVRLAQISLSSNSILDTEMTLDDEVTGHFKVTFTLKKQ